MDDEPRDSLADYGSAKRNVHDNEAVGVLERGEDLKRGRGNRWLFGR